LQQQQQFQQQPPQQFQPRSNINNNNSNKDKSILLASSPGPTPLAALFPTKTQTDVLLDCCQVFLAGARARTRQGQMRARQEGNIWRPSIHRAAWVGV
jgi:hypothetical protein